MPPFVLAQTAIVYIVVHLAHIEVHEAAVHGPQDQIWQLGGQFLLGMLKRVKNSKLCEAGKWGR